MMNMIYREQRDICETDAHQPKGINLSSFGFDQATPWMFLERYVAAHGDVVREFYSMPEFPMYVADGVRHGKSTTVVYRPWAKEFKFSYFQKGGQDNE